MPGDEVEQVADRHLNRLRLASGSGSVDYVCQLIMAHVRRGRRRRNVAGELISVRIEDYPGAGCQTRSECGGRNHYGRLSMAQHEVDPLDRMVGIEREKGAAAF